MKYLNYMITFFVILFLAVACSESTQLESNAEQGLKAFYSGDFDKAAKFATPRSQAILMQMKELIGEDRDIILQKGVFEVRLLQTTSTDSMAEVLYEVFNRSKGVNGSIEIDLSNVNELIRMEKINGLWLLDFDGE